MTRTIAELDVCHDCAVVVVNGDDSADPERAERAADRAFGVWGDGLRDLVMACGGDGEHDCPEDDFRCDYCGGDVRSYRHRFEILG